MIKILIADDHAIVREGLKQIVGEEADLQVTGEASSSEEMVQLLRAEKFDIVVLDINMPDKSGLEALKEIKIEFPQTPVLILSMYSEEQYGLRAIKAGAEGYLKKVSAPMELVNAIKKIVGGGKFISPELAEAMAENLKIFHNRKPHEILSDREYEVMRKIAMGKTAEEIADELSISVPTVYSYRNRVMDKMSMNSNVEIARYAEKNGLID